MYDFEQPNRGIATRDRQLHAARRRVWSRGFGDKALRAYEGRVAVYVQLLLEQLSKSVAARQSGYMARLTEYFEFDVMGDLGLSQDFGMLQHARQHVAIKQLVEGMAIATTGFLAFCYDHLDKMMAAEDRFERPSLRSIMDVEHLNAIINETLRLHPPASTIMRVTSSEGIVVADTFIPGDMTGIFVARWYAQPEMIKERAGFAPFSTGHHSCLGRPLALLEMRLLIAECVSRYDVTFAPGFDDVVFLKNVQDFPAPAERGII
ncbi:hypothetical protein DL770_010348 [Monosporascus sp. CRB-9-2]|nr:hypothetical protein DL770_010348 [Monosporascus sp. CRB-9-2]